MQERFFFFDINDKRTFSDVRVGEPGGVRLVCVLLFLRNREERMRELVLRVGEASTAAGEPFGVEGRLAGCTGSCCVEISICFFLFPFFFFFFV
jgi:hypothetical protein